MKQNTLSHHLADLTASGLVQVTRRRPVALLRRRSRHDRRLDRLPRARCGSRAARSPCPLALCPKGRRPMDPNIPDTDFDVLFICSGNSARSIFAEALLRDLGKGKFQAFSAGTRPNTELNPFALEILKRNGHDTSGLAVQAHLGVPAARRDRDGFRLHRLRHGGGRGMPALARPAHHRPLGLARPGESHGNGRRKGAWSLPRPTLRSAAPDHGLCRTAFRVASAGCRCNPVSMPSALTHKQRPDPHDPYRPQRPWPHRKACPARPDRHGCRGRDRAAERSRRRCRTARPADGIRLRPWPLAHAGRARRRGAGPERPDHPADA